MVSNNRLASEAVAMQVTNDQPHGGRRFLVFLIAAALVGGSLQLVRVVRDDDGESPAGAIIDAPLAGAVVQRGKEMVPIVKASSAFPEAIAGEPGWVFRLKPSSFTGLEPPLVIPVDSIGTVFYAAVEDALVIDRNRGVDQGTSFGTPVLRSVDIASGSDRLVARGVMTFAVRDDGALAMAMGQTPDVLNGATYVRDIVVRMPSGEESTWSPRPGAWEVLAWAAENLIVREHVSDGSGGYQALYVLNGREIRDLPGEYLAAVSPDGRQALLSRGRQVADLPDDEPVLFLVDLAEPKLIGVLMAHEVAAVGVRNLNPGSGDWRLQSVLVPADPVPLMLNVAGSKLSVAGTIPVPVNADTYGAKQVAFVGNEGWVVVLTEAPVTGSLFGERTSTIHVCTPGSCRVLGQQNSDSRSSMSIGMNPSRGRGRLEIGALAASQL